MYAVASLSREPNALNAWKASRNGARLTFWRPAPRQIELCCERLMVCGAGLGTGHETGQLDAGSLCRQCVCGLRGRAILGAARARHNFLDDQMITPSKTILASPITEPQAQPADSLLL